MTCYGRRFSLASVPMWAQLLLVLWHLVFPSSLQSKYYPGLTLLSFQDQTRAGMYKVVGLIFQNYRSVKLENNVQDEHCYVWFYHLKQVPLNKDLVLSVSAQHEISISCYHTKLYCRSMSAKLTYSCTNILEQRNIHLPLPFNSRW